MIIHKDFLDEPPRSPVHITIKEPQVAADLVDNKILRNDSCVSYEDITNQLFWTVCGELKYDMSSVMRHNRLSHVGPAHSGDIKQFSHVHRVTRWRLI